MKRFFWSILLVTGLCTLVVAEDLVTGPPAGTALSPMTCYANGGPFSGQESFDAAEVIGDGPGALLFVHVLNRNTAPVIRGVDNLSKEFGLFGFKSFIVTLSDDRTAAEERLRRVNGSLRLANPMVLSLDGIDGPGWMALNRRCTLSLVVMNGGKVVDSLGVTDTGLYDIERIRALAEKAVGELPTERSKLLELAANNLPEDPEQLRAMAARQAVELYQYYRAETEDHANSRRYGAQKMGQDQRRMNAQNRREMSRRGESAREGGRPARVRERPAAPAASESDNAPAPAKRERRGKPPEDGVLESLLRSYIRKTNDAARSEELMSQIVERSQESDELHQQTIAMFQLMLSFPDRYGTETAKDLARQFLKKHQAE